MLPDEIDINKDAVTVLLIKKIFELTDTQQYALLKQLQEPSFFAKEYGERAEIRKPYVNEIEFESKGQKYTGISKDISSSGMFILTDAPVSVGNTVILKIPYTNNQSVIRVPAEIIRKEATGIGLEFLNKGE